MTKPNTLMIDDVQYVRVDSVYSVCPTPCDDDFVIVRCRNAGVHAGYIIKRDANVLRLKNSRRLWGWWSKFTLSGLATEGPLESKMDEQRYACVVPFLELTVSDVCEVISCTAKARDAILTVPEWSNE